MGAIVDATHVDNVQKDKEERAEVFQACATIPILVKGESGRDGGKEVCSKDHTRAYASTVLCII